eukprot:GHVS01084427.1.p1 GENE.GHVS01084427.1~~GHVS01084427.1.p1  ORF type:complete len:186 (+),score=17.07 GHVS01084427.1:64-558(+)
MLASIRPRRVFVAGSMRYGEYCYPLAWSCELVGKTKHESAENVLVSVSLNPPQLQQQQATAALQSNRLQLLARRLHKHSDILPYRHRRSPRHRRCICIGITNLSYIEKSRRVWSCLKRDVVQVEVLQTKVTKPQKPSKTTYGIINRKAKGDNTGNNTPPPQGGV